MAKFTTKFVENVKPGPGRREIPDPGCSNLYLLLQPSGHRSWALRYRFGGKSIKLTLGQWPATTLLDARKAAIDAQRELGKGHDPAKAKVDSKIKADAAKADTVTAICERYLASFEAKKLRTVDQRHSTLRRLVYPALGAMPIETVRRSDIVRLLDKVEGSSGPRMADVTLATLQRIFRWHALRSDDFRSPLVPGMNRQKAADHRRDRILTDDEIRAVWGATANGTPFSALVRFLLISSARRNEAAAMKYDEVVDGIWTLPASRSKTKSEIVRPLSKAAMELIERMPRIEGCPYVFTSNGVTPIANFSDPKRKLDAASGVTGWRLHDLRRTARSLLSRCKGVTVDHAERVLGHALPGIRATYDKHDYAEEIRVAVEALAAMIEIIVNPPEGAVIPMRRR